MARVQIDKGAFTMDEKDSVKEFIIESEWARDDSVISDCVRQLMAKLFGKDVNSIGFEIISKGYISVTKDHYKKVNHIRDMLVKYGYGHHTKLVKLAFSIEHVYYHDYVECNYTIYSTDEDNWNKIL